MGINSAFKGLMLGSFVSGKTFYVTLAYVLQYKVISESQIR